MPRPRRHRHLKKQVIVIIADSNTKAFQGLARIVASDLTNVLECQADQPFRCVNVIIYLDAEVQRHGHLSKTALP